MSFNQDKVQTRRLSLRTKLCNYGGRGGGSLMTVSATDWKELWWSWIVDEEDHYGDGEWTINITLKKMKFRYENDCTTWHIRNLQIKNVSTITVFFLYQLYTPFAFLIRSCFPPNLTGDRFSTHYWNRIRRAARRHLVNTCLRRFIASVIYFVSASVTDQFPFAVFQFSTSSSLFFKLLNQLAVFVLHSEDEDNHEKKSTH